MKDNVEANLCYTEIEKGDLNNIPKCTMGKTAGTKDTIIEDFSPKVRRADGSQMLAVMGVESGDQNPSGELARM